MQVVTTSESKCRIIVSVSTDVFLDDPGLAGFDWFYASLVSGDNFWE